MSYEIRMYAGNGFYPRDGGGPKSTQDWLWMPNPDLFLDVDDYLQQVRSIILTVKVVNVSMCCNNIGFLKLLNKTCNEMNINIKYYYNFEEKSFKNLIRILGNYKQGR